MEKKFLTYDQQIEKLQSEKQLTLDYSRHSRESG